MDHTKKTHRKAGYILLLLAGTALGDMAASRAARTPPDPAPMTNRS